MSFTDRHPKLDINVASEAKTVGRIFTEIYSKTHIYENIYMNMIEINDMIMDGRSVEFVALRIYVM